MNQLIAIIKNYSIAIFSIGCFLFLSSCATPTPVQDPVSEVIDSQEDKTASVVENTQPLSKQELFESVVAGNATPVGTVFTTDSIATSTERFKGKYVVLDFWATWCGPCVKEGPIFQELGKQYKDKNVEFVGVSVDRDFSNWTRFLQRRQWEGQQYWMGMAEEEPFFGFAYSEVEFEPGELGLIVGLPKYVIIGPDGKILHNSSFIKPSNPKFEALLNSHVE